MKTFYAMARTLRAKYWLVCLMVFAGPQAFGQLTYSPSSASVSVSGGYISMYASCCYTNFSITPALPNGLQLDANTGTISGIPATVAYPATTYTVTASNSGKTTSTTVTIAVTDRPPSYLSYSNSTITVEKGSDVYDAPTVFGAVTNFSISPALPNGLSIDAKTGVLSGMPSVTSPGTAYTVTASNSGGSITATINITVNDNPPQYFYYPGSSFTFTQGTSGNIPRPTVVGGVPTSFTVDPALPAGLSIGTNGAITGTPTVVVDPAVNYQVTASNISGSASTTISITVKAIPPSNLKYTGSPFTFTQQTFVSISSPSISGSVTNFSVSPALPAGLYISSTGQISGIVTDVVNPGVDYTITASNSSGSTSTVINITVKIAPPTNLRYYGSPFTFTTFSEVFLSSPSVTGTVTNFSITPALPAGLSIDAHSGFISGNTSVVVNPGVAYTVTASNSTGSTSTTINITVNDAPPFQLSYYGSPYSCTINNFLYISAPYVQGNVTNYSISPVLPAGLAMDAGTGVISGSPSVAADPGINYTVKASNSAGSTTAVINITVKDVAVSSVTYGASLYTFTENSTITTLSPTSTGGKPTSYGISPSLPAGLLFNTQTGNITGKPTVIAAPAVYTVIANNGTGSASCDITLQVNYGPGATVYVDSAAGSDGNDGTNSWGNAFKTLSRALQVAAANPIQNIFVAKGTYYPAGTAAATTANSDSAFVLQRNGLRLYGGYNAATGMRNASVNLTYLDGANSSYHIMAIAGIGAGDSVIIDGVTLQNANARGGGSLHTYNGFGFNSNEGGAVAAKNNSGLGNNLLFRNCAFVNNNSANDGGAFYNAQTSPVFVNCLFANNAATNNGGAMFNYDGSNPIFTNCTIAYNVSAKGAAIDNYSNCVPILNNSIVWLNGTSGGINNSGITSNASPVATGSNSIIQGGVGVNSTADPLFVNAASGNFQLSTLSPAINAGSNSYYIGGIGADADLAGNARLTDVTIDMGAYEAAPPATVYVDAANGNDANLGNSWVTALKTLSGALKLTVTNHVTNSILIAAGTYYPAGTAAATAANSDSAFVLQRNGLRLYGGYNAATGMRNASVNLTYLDGANSSYHIMAIAGIGAGDSVIIDGVTLQNANARGGGSLHTYNGFGFNSNEGGAVAAKNNNALGNGLLFRNCLFTNNTSDNDAGAFYNAQTSPNFINCLFANNKAANNGGAMFNYDGSNPIFTNCTIAYNVSAKGAAIDNYSNCAPILNNSIVWLNGTSGGANNNGITSNSSPVATGSNSIIQGGVGANSTADPLFVNAASGNFQLSTISPAINAGNNSYYVGGIGTDADLAGNARLSYTNVDMGAYEYYGPYKLTYTGSPFTYTKGLAITSLIPTVTGPVTKYTVSPTLPDGLAIDAATGIISGTPTATVAAANYTITASNGGGSTAATISITINDAAPTLLGYPGSPFIFTMGSTIMPAAPSVSGGIVVSYAINPALPAGLTIDPTTGIISGTPTNTSPATIYTITAGNTGGISTTQVTITVNCMATASTTPVTVCASVLPYNWNGKDYNAAGSYTIHLTNVAGCDSAATLVLMVNQPTSSTTNVTVGANALPYLWNGNSYITAGSYTVHLTNSAGCDSAATLQLTVGQPTKSTTAVLICPTALPYTWNGVSYNSAGTYTVHLTNAARLDSAATLILSVSMAAPLTAKVYTASASSCGNGSDGRISIGTTGSVWPVVFTLTRPDGTTLTQRNNYVFNGLAPGIYTINATDTAGCTTTVAGVAVTQGACLTSKSVNLQPFAKSAKSNILEIKTYPNPSVNEFILEVSGGNSKESVEIRIIDMYGKTVYHTVGAVFNRYIFGNTFAAGIYIAEVLNGNNRQTIKLVKGK